MSDRVVREIDRQAAPYMRRGTRTLLIRLNSGVDVVDIVDSLAFVTA